MLRYNLLMMSLVLSLAGSMSAWAFEYDPYACGPIKAYGQIFGPFDYRTQKDRMVDMELVHFGRDVEYLSASNRSYIGGNLDYVLRAYPNHHRALLSMMKFGKLLGMKRVPGARYSVECYLARAVQWQAGDSVVRVLYADWLADHAKKNEALEQAQAADRDGGYVPNVAYNLGLVYFKLKDYDKALVYAHRAYAAGFSLPGLREMLSRVGKWVPSKEATVPGGASAGSGEGPHALPEGTAATSQRDKPIDPAPPAK